MHTLSATAPAPPPAPPPGRDPAATLRTKAADLEATFLAEMLSFAGLGATPEAFGGGIGEDQVASLLRQEQAAQIVAAGGLGLAEKIFRALASRPAAETGDVG
jgi:Rod binding domain-containing protein